MLFVCFLDFKDAATLLHILKPCVAICYYSFKKMSINALYVTYFDIRKCTLCCTLCSEAFTIRPLSFNCK